MLYHIHYHNVHWRRGGRGTEGEDWGWGAIVRAARLVQALRRGDTAGVWHVESTHRGLLSCGGRGEEAAVSGSCRMRERGSAQP